MFFSINCEIKELNWKQGKIMDLLEHVHLIEYFILIDYIGFTLTKIMSIIKWISIHQLYLVNGIIYN